MYKRPHLEYFLGELGKIAEVHLFTASHKEYAEQITEVIDKGKVIQKKFFRDVTTLECLRV